MKQPSLDVLLDYVDSKYTLVVATAKRAREITEGAPYLISEHGTSKPVTVALQEIGQGKLHYEKTKIGIK